MVSDTTNLKTPFPMQEKVGNDSKTKGFTLWANSQFFLCGVKELFDWNSSVFGHYSPRSLFQKYSLCMGLYRNF